LVRGSPISAIDVRVGSCARRACNLPHDHSPMAQARVASTGARAASARSRSRATRRRGVAINRRSDDGRGGPGQEESQASEEIRFSRVGDRADAYPGSGRIIGLSCIQFATCPMFWFVVFSSLLGADIAQMKSTLMLAPFSTEVQCWAAGSATVERIMTIDPDNEYRGDCSSRLIP
jgi:hypothetical protein